MLLCDLCEIESDSKLDRKLSLIVDCNKNVGTDAPLFFLMIIISTFEAIRLVCDLATVCSLVDKFRSFCFLVNLLNIVDWSTST